MTYKQERIIDFVMNIFTFGGYSLYRYVHLERIRSEDLPIIKAPFSKWVAEAKNINWKFDHKYPNSLFGEGDGRIKNHFHYDIVRINGVCYYMSSYGLRKAKRWVKGYNKPFVMKSEVNPDNFKIVNK